MHTIPVFGVDGERESLISQSRDVLPSGARISSPQRPDGVNVDPATFALVVDLSKDVLVAAITALGAIWAARIAASKVDRAEQPAPPQSRPAIEIDTLTDVYVVEIDPHFEVRLREVVPDNVKRVINIRLRN